MLDHIGVNVSDFDSAKDFYVAALAPLGYALAMEPIPKVAGFSMGDRGPQGAFPLWIAEGRGAPTVGHLAFTAPDRASVDAFHAAAVADGLNLEAVCHLPQ